MWCLARRGAPTFAILDRSVDIVPVAGALYAPSGPHWALDGAPGPLGYGRCVGFFLGLFLGFFLWLFPYPGPLAYGNNPSDDLRKRHAIVVSGPTVSGRSRTDSGTSTG